MLIKDYKKISNYDKQFTLMSNVKKKDNKSVILF